MYKVALAYAVTDKTAEHRLLLLTATLRKSTSRQLKAVNTGSAASRTPSRRIAGASAEAFTVRTSPLESSKCIKLIRAPTFTEGFAVPLFAPFSPSASQLLERSF